MDTFDTIDTFVTKRRVKVVHFKVPKRKRSVTRANKLVPESIGLVAQKQPNIRNEIIIDQDESGSVVSYKVDTRSVSRVSQASATTRSLFIPAIQAVEINLEQDLSGINTYIVFDPEYIRAIKDSMEKTRTISPSLADIFQMILDYDIINPRKPLDGLLEILRRLYNYFNRDPESLLTYKTANSLANTIVMSLDMLTVTEEDERVVYNNNYIDRPEEFDYKDLLNIITRTTIICNRALHYLRKNDTTIDSDPIVIRMYAEAVDEINLSFEKYLSLLGTETNYLIKYQIVNILDLCSFTVMFMGDDPRFNDVVKENYLDFITDDNIVQPENDNVTKDLLLRFGDFDALSQYISSSDLFTGQQKIDILYKIDQVKEYCRKVVKFFVDNGAIAEDQIPIIDNFESLNNVLDYIIHTSEKYREAAKESKKNVEQFKIKFIVKYSFYIEQMNEDIPEDLKDLYHRIVYYMNISKLFGLNISDKRIMELKTSIGIRGNSRVVLDDSEKMSLAENILRDIISEFEKYCEIIRSNSTR